MVAPRLSWLFASAACAAGWVLSVAPSVADSILGGTVTDAMTLSPVPSADIKIEYAGKTLGAGTTNIDGIYSVPFAISPDTPANARMTVSARSGNDAGSSNFQISGGNPVSATEDISIYPAWVGNCRSKMNHTVIIGNFLPPGGGALTDLSKRVARSLDFALNTRLQTVRLNLELLPSFQDCDAAKPASRRLGANYAKALRADAFVDGEVSQTNGVDSFNVSMSVSDAYGLFSMPLTASNTSVDLHNPSGASVAAETHVAVLASIAAGLASKSDCVNSIAVLSIAERLVDVAPPYLNTLRAHCESRVPNVGLRRVGP